MKIIECHVEGFGVLSDFDYTFTFGLNRICAPNGFGKTTLAAFCKAMLYGLPNSRKGASENERMRYQPWSGGKFGGWLSFSADGEDFRVERFFGSRSREDTVRVIELATGLETHRFPEPLGESLFGLDVLSFTRSTFLPEDDTPVQYTDCLSNRLGGEQEAHQAGAEAIALLNERRREYESLNGKRGRIADLQTKENECAVAARGAESLRLRLAELSRQEKAVLKKGRECREAYDRALVQEKQLREQAVRLAYAEQEAQLSRELTALEQKLRPIEMRYSNGLPDAQSCRICAERLIAWQASRASEQPPETDDALDREKAEKRLNAKYPWGLWLPVALFALFGVMILSIWRSGAYLAFCLAALCLLIALVCSAIYAGRKKRARRRLNASALRNREKADCPESVGQFCAHFALPINEHTVEKLYQMEQDTVEWERLSAEWQQKRKDLAAFRQEHPSAEAEAPIRMAQTPELCLEELQRTRGELQTVLQEKAECETALRAAWTAAEQRDALRAQREACEAERDAIDRTVQLLEQAKAEFSAKVLSRVKQCFGQYARQCFGYDIGAYEIDAEFTVWLERSGERRPSDCFSRGSRDLLAICLRLALAECLFEAEKPFLILDDPFVHLDDENRNRLEKLLTEIAERMQVICLCCRE